MSNYIMDYWERIIDNVKGITTKEGSLEFTAITSLAKGKHASIEKSFGVGKSSLALWISYVLHYVYEYDLKSDEQVEDLEDKTIWDKVLEHMTYDKEELVDFASRVGERIPAVIWDDAQVTAPALRFPSQIDYMIANFLTTSRTSVANIIMTMPELGQLSKPFRRLVNYEVIVPRQGVYEVQFIQTRKIFKRPYEDMKRMIFLTEGTYEPVPDSIYKRYLKWREKERRRILAKHYELLMMGPKERQQYYANFYVKIMEKQQALEAIQ